MEKISIVFMYSLDPMHPSPDKGFSPGLHKQTKKWLITAFSSPESVCVMYSTYLCQARVLTSPAQAHRFCTPKGSQIFLEAWKPWAAGRAASKENTTNCSLQG
jgi:hypothetical protein